MILRYLGCFMREKHVALFGEAEKGEYHKPLVCKSIPQLFDYFGHPPLDSRGIYYAVQALLYRQFLIFFRVQEEGFSYEDYLMGLRLLEQQRRDLSIAALYLPGVGNSSILKAICPVLEAYHALLITNEADFYDYLNQ